MRRAIRHLAHGYFEFYHPALWIGDITRDDIAADIGQLRLGVTLGGDEQDVRLIKRIDRLHRHVFRVSRTYTHDQNIFHAVTFFNISVCLAHG